MKTNPVKLFQQLVVPALALALVAGCSTGNYKKGASTGADLQASADRINAGTGKIDAVTASLNDLVNNPGKLADQFKKFNSAVSSLESAAKDVSSKVASMKEKGGSYFSAWDKELAQIQNEDIRTRSMERKADVQKKFDEIKNSYAKAAAAFKPFMQDVKDVQTALATDLTPGGVGALKSSAAKVSEDATPVKEALTQLAGQFKDLGVAMSAAAPKPAE